VWWISLAGGAQVSLAPLVPKTWLEGNLIDLDLPESLLARPGAMIRVSHQLFDHLELMAEVTWNESLVGTTNNGRVMFGFVFGRWARPAHLSNTGAPLGTDVPRGHYVIRERRVRRLARRTRCVVHRLRSL
jgi:hypothetical protein